MHRLQGRKERARGSGEVESERREESEQQRQAREQVLQRRGRDRTCALENGGVGGGLLWAAAAGKHETRGPLEADLEEGLMKLQEARKALDSSEDESAAGIVEAKALVLEAKTAFWRAKNPSKDEEVKSVERDIAAAEDEHQRTLEALQHAAALVRTSEAALRRALYPGQRASYDLAYARKCMKRVHIPKLIEAR
jgi:hypothetical protein